MGLLKGNIVISLKLLLPFLEPAQLPLKFWLEAITTTLYLINRMPNSSIDFQVPYHVLYKQAPDYTLLKPFGCCCFPWLRPYVSNKLVPRSTPCIFLGYCASTKAYRCLDPLTNRVSHFKACQIYRDRFSLYQNHTIFYTFSSILLFFFLNSLL